MSALYFLIDTHSFFQIFFQPRVCQFIEKCRGATWNSSTPVYCKCNYWSASKIGLTLAQTSSTEPEASMVLSFPSRPYRSMIGLVSSKKLRSLFSICGVGASWKFAQQGGENRFKIRNHISHDQKKIFAKAEQLKRKFTWKSSNNLHRSKKQTHLFWITSAVSSALCRPIIRATHNCHILPFTKQ